MKDIYEFPNKTFTNRSPSFTIEPFFCWHTKSSPKWKTGIFNIYHKPSRLLMTTRYTAEDAQKWCREHIDIYVNENEYNKTLPEANKKIEEVNTHKVKFPSVDELQTIHNKIKQETKDL